MKKDVDKMERIYQGVVDKSSELLEKYFPKGECMERGKALVFNAEMIVYIMGKITEERQESCKVGEEFIRDKMITEIEELFSGEELLWGDWFKYKDNLKRSISNEENDNN